MQGIPGVSVYIDDILVTGKTEEERSAEVGSCWDADQDVKMCVHVAEIGISGALHHQEGAGDKSGESVCHSECSTPTKHHSAEILPWHAELLLLWQIHVQLFHQPPQQLGREVALGQQQSFADTKAMLRHLTSLSTSLGVSMEMPPFTMTSFQSAHGQVAVWC